MTEHHFRVTARTVLQLGAELISSDGIALYELVKNGIDAGSPTVRIAFHIRIRPEEWVALDAACRAATRPTTIPSAADTSAAAPRGALEEVREIFLTAIDPTVDGSQELATAVAAVTSWKALRECFDDSNQLTVADSGRGMTRDTLIDAFLTIGTQVKLVERQARRAAGSKGRPILGEKGVGRLSAMRLGAHLEVTTTAAGDRTWHTLTIDWRRFEAQAGKELNAVSVAVERGARKVDETEAGTTLRIRGLRAAWSREQTEAVVNSYLARLADPFGEGRGPVRVSRNGERILVPRPARALLEHAHATIKGRYRVERDGPSFSGTIDYSLRQREGPITLGEEELLSLTSSASRTLRSLGPFDFTMYWWNRGAIAPIESIGETKRVKEELDRWSGGIGIYRDGFRVAPYGALIDDWLDLDRHAFRSPGYKLNRAQIIGKVDITGDENPALVDQTNREGLQHTAEFQALRALLKHLLESQIRPFLEAADKEHYAREIEPLGEMKERSRTIASRAKASLRALRRRVPDVVQETEVATHVEQLIKQLKSVLRNTQRMTETAEMERDRLTALAGIGLMVEVIAHELNRATENAVLTIRNAARLSDPARRQQALDLLADELKTLQKRLSVLDELSVSGRQRKTDVELGDWVRTVVEEWQPKFERHGITCTITGAERAFQARVVKGMVVQVLGNLLANSTYWLSQRRRRAPGFRPEIRVILDPTQRRITVVDNGPGVPDGRAETIFQPFVTTKPPGQGRGLGLFIAREIAKYHGGTLYLSDTPRIHAGRRNAFVFELGKDASSRA